MNKSKRNKSIGVYETLSRLQIILGELVEDNIVNSEIEK